MKIKLLAVGKTNDTNLQALINDYCERLTHYTSFSAEYITPPKQIKKLNTKQQCIKEGTLILQKLDIGDIVILLDENGKTFTSITFAHFIQKQLNASPKQLVFVIGGAYGFSDLVYKSAQFKIALSKLTFSHQMVRLFFVEQVYRAFTILRNESYHHQ